MLVFSLNNFASLTKLYFGSALLCLKRLNRCPTSSSFTCMQQRHRRRTTCSSERGRASSWAKSSSSLSASACSLSAAARTRSAKRFLFSRRAKWVGVCMCVWVHHLIRATWKARAVPAARERGRHELVAYQSSRLSRWQTTKQQRSSLSAHWRLTSTRAAALSNPQLSIQTALLWFTLVQEASHRSISNFIIL